MADVSSPLVLVDLTSGAVDPDVLAALRSARPQFLLGFADRPLDAGKVAVTDLLDATVVPASPSGPAPVPPSQIPVPDVEGAVTRIVAAAAATPRACATLAGLLRAGAALDVPTGLSVESAAYSMLLAGPEFAAWRSSVPVHEGDGVRHRVALRRSHELLEITLDRPARHNAVDRHMRDALAEAFDLVLIDPSITHVDLRGAGASFCSGGDLDEFGSAPDVATAHVLRLEQSVGARVHRCRERVVAHLHGACIGAGIELPAFADRVVAAPDTFVQLPELSMGLVPGAGGTVSITRRIGRWRTAYLALTGVRLGVDTSLEWGLVDATE